MICVGLWDTLTRNFYYNFFMNLKNTVCKKLNILYPLIQAPMAGGITTPKLVSSVSNAGALGSLAAGYLHPDEIKKSIEKIRALTQKPFAVNLFIPEKYEATETELQSACRDINNACLELDINIHPPLPPYAPNFDEQVSLVLQNQISIVSFTFGILSDEWIAILKNKNVTLIGTATHLQEAKLLQNAGVDIVVLQGIEAGGHRGTFIYDEESHQQPVFDLVAEIASSVSIPVVAAGGIMNCDDVKKAMEAGASAVQIGTAFITSFESGASETYKKKLLSQVKNNTVLTRAFSGKYARGINNTFIERMKDKHILDYPIQHALTGSMRKIASEKNNPEYMSLWAGVGVAHCIESTASEIVKKLTEKL